MTGWGLAPTDLQLASCRWFAERGSLAFRMLTSTGPTATEERKEAVIF